MTSEFDRAIGEADTASPIGPQQAASIADESAEHAICAGVIHVRDAASEIDGLCRPEDFFARPRAEIVRAALTLHRAGDSVDEATIAAALTRRRVLQGAGGIEWLRSFREPVPTLETLRTLARTVAELAHARRMVETARLIVSEGLASTDAPREFVERAVEKITGAAESRTTARVTHVSDVLDQLDKEWERNRREGLLPDGMPTGFDGLDLITHGMRLGEVSFVGALTGRGKSVYALQIANHVAGRVYNKRRVGVVYVSGEMSDKKLTLRGLCSRAQVSERDIARVMSGAPAVRNEPDLDPHEAAEIAQRVNVARDEMRRLPISYFAHVASINDIRAAIRDAARGWRERAFDPEDAATPMVVVVDYVQMMRVSKKTERHELALADFTYELKDIADRQSLHVICAAQMTKSIRDRGAGSAQAEDMKNASALAESASTVIYIHRPAYDQPKGSERRLVQWPYSELQITKGRDHGLGEVPMMFEGKHYRFREPSRDEVHDLYERVKAASTKAGSADESAEAKKAYAPGNGPSVQRAWAD